MSRASLGSAAGGKKGDSSMNTHVAAQETFAVGEQPGTGHYRCCKCGEYVVELIKPTDQIPPCENCDSAPDVRYRIEDQEAAESHGP